MCCLRSAYANRGGRCAICDERIYPGDEVDYEDDELVHAECVEEDDE